MSSRKAVKLATESIEIERFIFHVVHHGENTPILMSDYIPITGFESFFKERIVDVLEGNKFEFKDDSNLLIAIREIEEDETKFIDYSKKLAISFHAKKDDRIKPGVMIFMKAMVAQSIKYILIKYDNEDVLTYSQEGGSAVLKEISNTFSKDKRALQKSAIIDVTSDNLVVEVIDLSIRNSITKFFKEFLGVKRKYSKKELTTKVQNAFVLTIKKFKEELPFEITSRARHLFFDTIQNKEFFLKETFLESILGNNYDPKMDEYFDKQLRKVDISDESFSYDKSIGEPKDYKYRTKEGVTIKFPATAGDTVKIEEDAIGKKAIITIITSKLIEE